MWSARPPPLASVGNVSPVEGINVQFSVYTLWLPRQLVGVAKACRYRAHVLK